MSPNSSERPSLIPTLRQVNGQEVAVCAGLRRSLGISRSLSLLAMRSRPIEPTSGLAGRARRWTRDLFAVPRANKLQASSSPNLLLESKHEQEAEQAKESEQKKRQAEKGKHKLDRRQKNNKTNLTGARKLKIQEPAEAADQDQDGQAKNSSRMKEQRAFWQLR